MAHDSSDGVGDDEDCIKHAHVFMLSTIITTSHLDFFASKHQSKPSILPYLQYQLLRLPIQRPTSRMYTFITLITLFAAALAAPAKQARQTLPTLNFAVSNDVSGAQVGSSILADGNAVTFIHDFAGTALDRDGRIIATSMQSTSNGAGIFCIISDGEDNQVGLLNEQTTFVDLDGQEGAVETDVSDFTILCEA